MTQKIDLKRTHRDLFAPRRGPGMVDVPSLPYLMVDGRGAPESQVFQDAIQALYSTAYTIKFMLKAAGRTDFVVAPLEALWWAEDPRVFDENRRDDWRWTMMVMLPEHVEEADLRTAFGELRGKKKLTPFHDRVRLSVLEEGRAATLLHVGPYNDVGPSIERLRVFAAAAGYRSAGKHHEIYLSDPRRAAPDRLKTILRQPVVPLP